MPEGRAVTQRDRERLEECIARSLIKLSKEVRSLAHAGGELTEEQVCRKGPVVLVDTMSTSLQLGQTRSASSQIILASCKQQV